MPKLYGKNWTRRQLEKYAGASWQTGSVRRYRFVEGTEDGTEVLQFDAGNGLQFQVLPHRGLDIASASYCGASLCYHTQVGETHPAYFDPDGLGLLKSFYAGLVTTCGLSWAGAPCEDQGESLGLHGRVSHLPARQLKYGEEWIGNHKRLYVTGDVRESHLFGPNLVMTRTISTETGSHTISIEDTVRNEGFESSPHMMLYHINLGFPLLSEEARLEIDSNVWARDPFSETKLFEYNKFETPVAKISEQVFYHEVKADSSGYCKASLINEAFNNGQGLGVMVRYRKKELPRFAQWKNIRAGMYVCGLEPCNCSVQGRAHDREAGILQQLKPGQEMKYHVEITVLPDRQAIDDALKRKKKSKRKR